MSAQLITGHPTWFVVSELSAICSVMIQPSILTMRRATNCWDREAGQSQNYDSDQVST